MLSWCRRRIKLISACEHTAMQAAVFRFSVVDPTETLTRTAPHLQALLLFCVHGRNFHMFHCHSTTSRGR